MAERDELVVYCDALLEVGNFADYCPNGLQVEGRPHIGKLVSGVSACQALIDRAIEQGADAILVHHGYFWKGEAPTVLGMKRRRLQALLGAQLNLLVYHLPLDAHPVYGNNAQLGRQLGAQVLGALGAGALGLYGRFDKPLAAAALADRLAQRLGRAPLLISGGDEPIRTVAWCSGAAQDGIERAAACGAQAYISGEVSERTVHSARELGIHYFAAGHHATERYGVQALGAHLAEHFAIEHAFIEIDNPV